MPSDIGGPLLDESSGDLGSASERFAGGVGFTPPLADLPETDEMTRVSGRPMCQVFKETDRLGGSGQRAFCRVIRRQKRPRSE
jgi:hypothetical protein